MYLHYVLTRTNVCGCLFYYYYYYCKIWVFLPEINSYLLYLLTITQICVIVGTIVYSSRHAAQYCVLIYKLCMVILPANVTYNLAIVFRELVNVLNNYRMKTEMINTITDSRNTRNGYIVCDMCR